MFPETIRAQNPNDISFGSAHPTPYTSQWAALSPLKIAPSHGRIWIMDPI